MRRSLLRMAVIGATALCIPAVANASGRLPIPPTTQHFRSHQACIAALQEAYEADKKQILPLKRQANGDTREISLDTKGIERLGTKRARYEATIWFHNGRFDSKFQKTETSHTFEQRLRECRGKTLRVSGENGFTLSTLDP